MIQIESIKRYQGVLPPHLFHRLTDQLYDQTAYQKEDYPNYREWFYDVQVAGLDTPQRDILLAHADHSPYNVIGLACLKNTPEERKLCTLVVNNGYRRLGVGGKLLTTAIDELGTDKPFFTLPDYRLGMYQPLITRHDWQLEQRLHGYYNDRHSELCFNGKLMATPDALPTPTPRKKTTCTITPIAEIEQTAETTITIA